MKSKLKDLKNWRVLVTNDDGFSTEGIKILHDVASSIFKEVWLMAPSVEQSGKGHSLTLREPIDVIKRGSKIYSINGTPADCVILAINHFMQNNPPDLILSGINKGANIGEDITYSGTIGAAIESTILGVPAIALSQEIENKKDIDWRAARQHSREVIRTLLQFNWPVSTLMNVNFPAKYTKKAKLKATKQGKRKVGDEIFVEKKSPTKTVCQIGNINFFETDVEGTDISAIKEEHISITPITVDFTNHLLIKELREYLKSESGSAI